MRVVGQRKVPQWLFLGHFFNDLLLADTAAKGASSSSISRQHAAAHPAAHGVRAVPVV
ncbi:MAG: hypothetical protein WDO73_00495 [Ignavibacteriota bacterium]